MERKEIVEEALKRMKKLGLSEYCQGKVKKGSFCFSEGMGANYDIDDETQWVSKIKEVESKYNLVVYHAIHNVFEFGECLTLLYVDDIKEEWDQDNEDIKDLIPMSYVINLDSEECSEFGCVGVKPAFGGLVRIA